MREASPKHAVALAGSDATSPEFVAADSLR